MSSTRGAISGWTAESVNARGALAQSLSLALVCLASDSLVAHGLGRVHSLSHADDLIGGLCAVVATVLVFRTTHDESVAAAKSRAAATALSSSAPDSRRNGCLRRRLVGARAAERLAQAPS
jgi:hypothetical protein